MTKNATKAKKRLNFIFEKSALKPKDYPKFLLPEFAFLGRSNVGKSSLINKVTNHKSLAKTSKTPGRTQMVNFFLVQDKLRLVDLPGYGYANVSKKKINELSQVILNYLANRENLKLLFLLLDARRDISENDFAIIDYCADNEIAVQIVLTKIDKIKNQSEAEKQIENLTNQFKLEYENEVSFIVTSASKNKGINNILTLINNLS